jgi:hypothetical protein
MGFVLATFSTNTRVSSEECSLWRLSMRSTIVLGNLWDSSIEIFPPGCNRLDDASEYCCEPTNA